MKHFKQRCPSGKDMYFSEPHAETRKKQLEKKRRIKLRIYECPLCFRLHLTKTTQRSVVK